MGLEKRQEILGRNQIREKSASKQTESEAVTMSVIIQVAPAVQRKGPNLGPLGVPTLMG